MKTKFKNGDIVVVKENTSSQLWASREFQERSRICKSGTVSIIKDPKYNNSPNTYAFGNQPIARIKVPGDDGYIRFKVDDLRIATEREQFLYHILGPHVLGEENEV